MIQLPEKRPVGALHAQAAPVQSNQLVTSLEEAGFSVVEDWVSLGSLVSLWVAEAERAVPDGERWSVA
ncbi:MAG: hypothetical protein AB1453_00615 [Chloroflexota bacterium]|jgi:hypothetical protein